MHKLVISKEWAAPSEETQDLFTRLKAVNGEPVHIYRMSCGSKEGSPREGSKFEIVTTSKEVFLTIGTFPNDLKLDFCWVLNEEYLRTQENVMLVLITDQYGNERKYGLLVSRTKINECVQFHLAKAQ